jgi:hypothetical protein
MNIESFDATRKTVMTVMEEDNKVSISEVVSYLLLANFSVATICLMIDEVSHFAISNAINLLIPGWGLALTISALPALMDITLLVIGAIKYHNHKKAESLTKDEISDEIEMDQESYIILGNEFPGYDSLNFNETFDSSELPFDCDLT